MRWKGESYFHEPEALSTNNACELGKWIVGEAIKYVQLEEYLTLKAEHAKFHLAVNRELQIT